eukprot:640540-Hanusia_phi.AAC.1
MSPFRALDISDCSVEVDLVFVSSPQSKLEPCNCHSPGFHFHAVSETPLYEVISKDELPDVWFRPCEKYSSDAPIWIKSRKKWADESEDVERAVKIQEELNELQSMYLQAQVLGHVRQSSPPISFEHEEECIPQHTELKCF